MAMWYSFFYGIIYAFLLCLIFLYLGKFEFSEIFLKNIYYDKYNMRFFLYFAGIIAALLVFIFSFLLNKDKQYEIKGIKSHKITGKKTIYYTLYNIAEEISIAAGMKKVPELYILNSNILNAYTCGVNPDKSSIVISKGFLELLNRSELQGIIAHEISHIINRDTMYLLCAGILFNVSSKFGSLFTFRGRAGAPLPLPLEALSWLGQSICYILFIFISREREYLADACAVLYTRNPAALASAMHKIEQASKNNMFQNDAEEANLLIKASFFAPVKGDNTHPDTKDRIKILSEMKTTDLNEYEKIYEKLKGKSLLPKSALKDAVKIDIIPPPLEGEGARRAGEGFNEAVYSACSLNSLIDNKEQTNTLRENKALLKENIKKHREIEDLVRDLAEYKIINCECGTKLKIPPVYKNQIIICPHCGKKHTV